MARGVFIPTCTFGARGRRRAPMPVLLLRGAVAAACGTLVSAAPALAEDAAASGWSFDLTGRLQLDATAAEEDLTARSDSWTDAEVRRARIGVDGERGPLAVRVEVGLEDEPILEDGWAQYDAGAVTLGVGQSKTPTSFEFLTSSRFMTPFERASFVEAFGLDRRLGVWITARGERYGVQAGVYGGNAAGDADATAEGSAVAARATYDPVLEDDLVVHLGLSAQHREAASGKPFEYSARPRIHLSESTVDTGAFADADAFVGLEVGVIAGRLHLLGEQAFLAADGPRSDADLSGGYLEAGVFLTPGDRLGYKEGVVDRTEPAHPVGKGGWGAWQLRGRVDHVDLRDGAAMGGEQTAWSIGLNWIATSHARIVTEISQADVEDGPDGSGEVVSASLRGAVDW